MAYVTFVGGAQARKQIDTCTVAGTPASTETLYIECNAKRLTLTLPSGQTTSQVAAEMAASINATSADEPEPATGYTRSCGGREIPEFRDFTAEASGSTVILTSVTSGVPFTVTVGETMASGTFTKAATQTATGPNHVDNAANYRDGALPVANETFSAEGDVDMLYGLDYLDANNVNVSLEIDLAIYTGQIGLPATNANGKYDEYRTRCLEFDGGAGVAQGFRLYDSVAGAGAQSTKIIRLDFKARDGDTIIVEAGRGVPATPNITLVGTGNPDSPVIVEGSVRCEIGFTGTPVFGRDGGADGALLAVLVGGASTGNPLEDCETATFRSGVVRIHRSDRYDGGGVAGALNILGGKVYLLGPNQSNRPTYNIYKGGTLLCEGTYDSGGADVYVFSGGSLDLSGGTSVCGFASVNLYSGSNILDADGLAGDGTNNVYQFVACSPTDLTGSKLPANLQYTTAALP